MQVVEKFSRININLYHLEKNLEKSIKKELVEAQKGDVESTFADIGYLHKLVGYKPKVGLDVGIQRFVQWFKSYYG